MVRKKKESFLIGIIGFGQFGKLLASFLKKEFKIIVYSKPKPKNFPKDILWGNPKEIVRAKIVILAVPISALEKVLKKFSPLVKKNSLVVDVCSVKKYPVELMKKILPKNIEILATHPLFGPESAKKGLRGLKIVLWPVRLKKGKYNSIKKWLRKKRLRVVEISPAKHDRLIAKTQALTYFIGRILKEMRISSTPIDTPSFKKLLELKESISKDTPQLSLDIQKFNPYTKKIRKDFKKALQNIEKMIEER